MPFTQMRWQMSAVLRADYDASHNSKEKISAGSGTSSRSHLRPLMMQSTVIMATFTVSNMANVSYSNQNKKGNDNSNNINNNNLTKEAQNLKAYRSYIYSTPTAYSC